MCGTCHAARQFIFAVEILIIMTFQFLPFYVMQKEGKKCVEEVAAKLENGGRCGLKRRMVTDIVRKMSARLSVLLQGHCGFGVWIAVCEGF